jgi:hypothetical protein
MAKAFVAALIALPIFAQLPTPNAAGVTAGHHIFTVKDLDATNKFWHALGAGDGELGPLKLIKFPGALLYIPRAGSPTGGTEGSTIDYLGFKVKDLKATLASLDAIGYKPMAGATATQAFVMGPDTVKVKLTEDKGLATQVTADEIHMVVPKAAADWYAKYFGGPNIPGARLTFSEPTSPVVGTQGRAFGTMGLEVKDLQTTYDKLKDSGAQIAGNINTAKGFPLAVFVITDPWGTRIEISQGLNAVK